MFPWACYGIQAHCVVKVFTRHLFDRLEKKVSTKQSLRVAPSIYRNPPSEQFLRKQLVQAAPAIRLVLRATPAGKVLINLTPAPHKKASRHGRLSSDASASGNSSRSGNSSPPAHSQAQRPDEAHGQSRSPEAVPSAASLSASTATSSASTASQAAAAQSGRQAGLASLMEKQPSGQSQKGAWGKASGVLSSLGSGLGGGLGLGALQPLAASLNQHSWVGPSGLARTRSGAKSAAPKRQSSDLPASSGHPAGQSGISQNSPSQLDSQSTDPGMHYESPAASNQLDIDPGNIQPAWPGMTRALSHVLPRSGASPPAAAVPAEEVVEAVRAAAAGVAAEHAQSAGEMTRGLCPL